MNLPFTPSSFKKLDILQQLMEFESEKKRKTLWNGVKSVLIWSSSEHHQHLGSAIGINHIKDALNYCVEEFFISEGERDRLRGSSRHILESLSTYGFGELIDTGNPKSPSLKINRNGILAGRILVETEFLTNTWWRYNLWIIVWWIVLAAAAIILFSQTLNAIKTISTFSNQQNNLKTNDIIDRRFLLNRNHQFKYCY